MPSPFASALVLGNAALRNNFGLAVTYTPQGAAAVAITAVFDAAHERVEVDGGVPVSTTSPQLDVVLADFSTQPRKGDACVVGGLSYVVTEVRPDGNGMAELQLRRA